MRMEERDLSWREAFMELRKLPPKTSDSSGVHTAWIQALGMNTVWPAFMCTLQGVRRGRRSEVRRGEGGAKGMR